MTKPTRFVSLTPQTAPAASAPLLRASEQQFGFLPAPVARAGHSPAYLKHLLAGFAAFDRTSLSELEREVVAMTVAFEIECHYCMALHSAMLARSPAHAPYLEALREGRTLPDSRLQALQAFALAIVRDRARVAPQVWTQLERAGFTPEQQLDILLGVGVYLFSTLGNVLTDSPLDPAFAAFAWAKPIAGAPPSLEPELRATSPGASR